MPTLAVNKRAKFDYEFLKEFEGGLALTGAEVKAVRAGNLSMQGAYLTIRGNEVFLKGMHIGHYKPAGVQEKDTQTRDRKVLMHKREIAELIGKKQVQGLTLVPISVYTKGDFIKLGFAVARGKKKYEKRDVIKKRDLDREAREVMKRNTR